MSNPIIKVIVTLLVILSSTSCEKKQDNNARLPIIAGTINDNMLSYNFTPETKITYVWDGRGYGTGSDSIDLLNDASIDFTISAKFLDYNAFLACCPAGTDCLPYGMNYWFIPRTKISVAVCSDTGEFHFTFADTLNTGYRIDPIQRWSDKAKMWCLDYPYPYEGTWYFVKSEDKYLAIRMGDSTNYKYGWIRLGADPDHNLVFKGYAVEN